MNIEIKITGSSKPKKIAAALQQIAKKIANGDYKKSLKEKGECEWEDKELFTRIIEEEREK